MIPESRCEIPTARPDGCIASGDAQRFVGNVRALSESGNRCIIVDLSGVSFISKVAVIGLVDLSVEMAQRGAIIGLVNVKEVVRNLIALRRDGRHLQIFGSEAEARDFILHHRSSSENYLGAINNEPEVFGNASESITCPHDELESLIEDGIAVEDYRALESEAVATVFHESSCSSEESLGESAGVFSFSDEELSQAMKGISSTNDSVPGKRESSEPTPMAVDDADVLCDLESDDARRRWAAIRKLGFGRDDRAIPRLKQIVFARDEYQFNRDMARISLRRLGVAIDDP